MGQFIAFTIVGIVIITPSYLIKYKKMAWLISGYDEDLVADKDGLCNWIGGTLIWPGIAAIIAGAVLWKYPEQALWGAGAFGAVTVGAIIIALVGAKKFKKNRD